MALPDGTTQTNSTDAEGGFCFEKVPADAVATFTATKEEYVDGTAKQTVTDKMFVKIYLSPVQTDPKDWRIVLTWGMKPLDLDARTYIGNNWNGQSPNVNVNCDVSYESSQRDVLCPKNNIGGKLDLDHCFYTKDGKWSCNKAYSPGGPSSEAKPETTTLTNVDPETCGDDCKIVFHVTRYMVCRDWERDGYP